MAGANDEAAARRAWLRRRHETMRTPALSSRRS
jgi:hypothetical protein